MDNSASSSILKTANQSSAGMICRIFSFMVVSGWLAGFFDLQTAYRHCEAAVKFDRNEKQPPATCCFVERGIHAASARFANRTLKRWWMPQSLPDAPRSWTNRLAAV